MIEKPQWLTILALLFETRYASTHLHWAQITNTKYALFSNKSQMSWLSQFPHSSVGNRDGDFSWTMNSRGHFFQNGRILVSTFWVWILVDILCEFLWTFFSTRIPLSGWIFLDIFWVNYSGHFFVVITNGANTAREAPC